MGVARAWRKIPEYYNLEGRKCLECSQLFFPVRNVCSKCGNYKLDRYWFRGKGKIVTFTVIRTPFSEVAEGLIEIPSRNLPYILAIVQLEEGPMLTAEIVDCLIEDVEIGKDVEVVFRKIMEKGESGVIQYGYKFRPIER